MDEFREIHFQGSMLRVYKTGEIWRWIHLNTRNNKLKDPYWKQVCVWLDTKKYFTCYFNKKYFRVHRIIAMVYLGLDIVDTYQEVDHIDRCTTNNNIINLRIVTHQQNMWNSNVTGYYWNPQNKNWRVKLHINSKVVYQKSWKTEEDAAADYIKQKEIYHIIPYNDTTQSVLLNSPVSDDLESMDA